MNYKKVIVGLSGGVDSAVAAYLLKQQGYEVIGATVKIYGESDPDSEKIAAILGIEHVILDYTDVFKKQIINNFSDEYKKARTPNPCVRCNRFIKWQALIDYADAHDAAYIATGHYSQIEKLPNGRFSIKKNASQKDQTYVLCMLTQEQLSRTLMPLGEMEKDDVRKLAMEIGLPVCDKPDSQDICFIPDGDYAAFLETVCGTLLPEGNFINEKGEIIGRHKGIHHYTIGQRRGLEFAAGSRVYVSSIDAIGNTVTLGSNESLFKNECFFIDVNFMSVTDFANHDLTFGGADGMFSAKVRYGKNETPCDISKISDDTFKCEFKKPVRAITPGQALVIYKGDYVAAGGVIISEPS